MWRPRVAWLRELAQRPGLILLYHRVARLPLDPWELSVSPEHFHEHLEVLRRCMTPVSLARLAPRAPGDRMPRRAVAVTFDDGYLDNLDMAKPALERHDVPATVFVASGAVAAGREFWWDELEALLLTDRPLPRALRLAIDGRERTWDLPVPDPNRKTTGWRAGSPPPSPRHTAFLEIWRALRDSRPETRDELLSELCAWAGGSRPRPSHRVLDEAHLRRLAEGKLIEIGAHSVTHSPLAALPVEEQAREIRGSKTALEEMIGAPVMSFAYPFGGARDYGDDAARLVREAGFQRACAVSPRAVTARSDPYRLPRIAVTDCDGDRFAEIILRRASGHGA